MRYIAAQAFFVVPPGSLNPENDAMHYAPGDPVPDFESWPPIVKSANLRCGRVQLETGNLTGPEAVDYIKRSEISERATTKKR